MMFILHRVEYSRVYLTADGKDKQNKSQIEAGKDYGEKKGIPANRPGAETDMAQTALYIACNQYLYGQVSVHVAQSDDYSLTRV